MYSPDASETELSESARAMLSDYCTRVDLGTGRRLDLFSPSMFRIRESRIEGNPFPLAYEIPFAVGCYEPWKPVSYARHEDDVFVYITTETLQIRVFKVSGAWLVWDREGVRQICPSEGSIFGLFRDGYTLFDAASAFNEPSQVSRYAHHFYNPDTRRYDIHLADDALIDRYFIYGPDYPALFAQFNKLVGPEPMLRRKGYGFHQTQHLACLGTQTKLLQMVEQYRLMQLPLDTVIIDFEWGDGCDGSKGVTWGSRLDWSSSYRTPQEPREFLRKLQQLNVDVMLIYHSAPDFPGRVRQGWTSAVYSWDKWWEAVEARLDEGIAGTWQDTRNNDITDHFIYQGLAERTGQRPMFLGNYDLYENCGWRHEKLTSPQRNAIGMRRTPHHWTGDEESTWWEYAFKVRAVANTHGPMKAINYLSTDVRCNDWKLQARWTQFADFLPVARTHTQKPWRANEEFLVENFAFQADGLVTERDRKSIYESETPEDIARLVSSIRKHRGLRYQLMPYLYRAAREAYDTGMPILRPMLLAFPDDPACNRDQYPYQYLFGPDLLLAPVLDQRFARQAIYLPAGHDWIDYWDGTLYTGGQTIQYDVSDIEKLPIWVRAGAILPMQPASQWLTAEPPQVIILDTYPREGPTQGVELYDDDGLTLEYQRGAYAKTLVACNAEPGQIVFSIGAMEGQFASRPERRSYIFQLHRQTGVPSAVTYNGEPIPPRTEVAPTHGPDGWQYDAPNQRLCVRVTQPTARSGELRIDSPAKPSAGEKP